MYWYRYGGSESGPGPPGELLMSLSQAQCLWLVGPAIDVLLFGSWHNLFLTPASHRCICTFRVLTVLLSKELGMDQKAVVPCMDSFMQWYFFSMLCAGESDDVVEGFLV